MMSRSARTESLVLALCALGCHRAPDGTRVPPLAVRPDPSRIRSVPVALREAQVAPPAPHRCALEGEPHTVAPRAALDTGLSFVPLGTAFALGWGVPGPHPTAAGVTIGLDGAPGAAINATQPALSRDILRFSRGAPAIPTALYHVIPYAQTDGTPGLRADRRLEIDAGDWHQYILQCGGVSDLAASNSSETGQRTASGDFGACHSISDSGEPLIVTIMFQSTRESVSTEVELHVTRGAIPRRGDRPVATQMLEIAHGNPDAFALTRDAEPRNAMRPAISAFEPQMVAAPGGGYALSYRDGHHIYLLWLDAALHPRGTPASVATLGGTPGVARLASNGREVLMVWADRAQDRPTPGGNGSTRYALHVRHFAPGTAPGTTVPSRLATTGAEVTAADGEQDEFAPSAAALDDGTWLVAWSRGPLRASRNGRPSQSVFVRHYAADLSPIGDAIRIDAPQGTSDARIVARQGRFVVASLAGRGTAREVRTYAGRCDLP